MPQWLAYQLTNNELVLRNLSTGKERNFPAVVDYLFSNKGNSIVLKTSTPESASSQEQLIWINLENNIKSEIWSNGGFNKDLHVSEFNFDLAGNQLAFIVNVNLGENSVNEIWYYKANMSQAISLVNTANRMKLIQAY